MCSIGGTIRGTGAQKMLNIQKHRAPDEQGLFKDKYIELGMGRLKIIDLISPGLAPYREDNFVLSYNGEIYNYLEIKKELLRLGWKFRTNSDTEVFLKSWRQWGPKMFDKFNGMFACAIYDSRKKQLLLARDIAGEKPLYYYQKGKKFAFSSEAKALAEVLNLKKQKNQFFEAFQHCFTTTLWKDVLEIPPAHYLLLDIVNGNKKIIEYWKFKPRHIDLATAPEELENLLENSVKLRIRSDVPVGLYYSGGIDSSLISSLYDFKHKFYFDDAKDWKDDFFKNVGQIVWHLDFPVGSLSSYPLWKLAQIAGQKVKVVISGEGADEIFGGYVRYMPIAAEWNLRKEYPSYSYLFNKHFPNYLDGFAKITARNGDLKYVKSALKPFFDKFDDPISAMGYADFKLILPSLLQMGDRMSGAFGIENRCPFLDKRIIEFGFSLPPQYKISGTEQKIILREILKKRGLTQPLKKEKKGLIVPFNKLLGREDWDRGAYLNLLKKEWDKHYKNEIDRN